MQAEDRYHRIFSEALHGTITAETEQYRGSNVKVLVYRGFARRLTVPYRTCMHVNGPFL